MNSYFRLYKKIWDIYVFQLKKKHYIIVVDWRLSHANRDKENQRYKECNMAVRQLSIFLENRKGRLAAIAKILGNAGINIRALSVADTSEFGILRLIVENVEEAEKALRASDVVLHINDVTAVEIDNQPGGLASVLDLLNDSSINVEYMYALAEPKSEKPVLILRFSEPKVARELLRKGGARLLDEADLGMK